MNAAQLRRLEGKLIEAEEFFDHVEFDPQWQVMREQLHDLIGKVVAERIRAESKDSRHPFSKRAAL